MTHKDPVKHNEYNRKWRAANLERARKYDRDRYPARYAQKQEYKSVWNAANPEKVKGYQAKAHRKNAAVKSKENLILVAAAMQRALAEPLHICE